MKFLIFNILVFFALGYLLTSNSNQNFKSWFTDKKDQITNLSKKDYVDKLKTAVSSNTDSTTKKNLSENKQIMDSTSISDIMGQPEAPLEPPMMAQDPRMTQMQMQAPMMKERA